MFDVISEIGLRVMEIMGCASKVHYTPKGENQNALGGPSSLTPH
ncbi:MAG: hypothetical protein ACLFT8_05875 [Desulfovermiculus sp.]